MSFAVSQGQSFILYDDDDFNNNDGINIDGDSGSENVSTPDTDILQSVDTPCANVVESFARLPATIAPPPRR